MVDRATNYDGLTLQYGTRDAEGHLGAGRSFIEEALVFDFDYQNLPGFDADASGAFGTTVDSFSGAQAAIPANAIILDAYMQVKTAFTSTSGMTTLDVGVYQQDGTVIDADGIFSAIPVDNATTGMGTADNVIPADGVMAVHTTGTFDVGTGSPSTDAYVKVTPSTSDLTAGEARLIIRYLLAR